MGDSVEQWRATIGQWSGGSPGKCVTLRHSIVQSSNHIGYRPIRFLVLLSLLVIGCVELNPGPDHETSASPQTAGALLKFPRRSGTDVLHGGKYEIRTAAFIFARALSRTEEFHLASNVNGAGAFDDLVFRYRLREPDVWKTCFIQLKHKKSEGAINLSSLIKMSGDFSLFKYFNSYCQIKSKASTESNLRQYGPFVEFEFVIYTNASMQINSPLQEGDSDPVGILSSGPNHGKYVSFDEKLDKGSLKFFEELSEYYGLIVKLGNVLKRGPLVDEEINKMIEMFHRSVTNKEILGSLNSLKSTLKKDGVTRLIKEVAKHDFNLFKEFLSKVKIFQNQSNEGSFKGLIEKELRAACKASGLVANTIYSRFEEGISKWWKKVGKVVWLAKDSHPWQKVEKYLITEIKGITEPELQEIVAYGIRFKQQHIQRLCDAINRNTFLNIVTNPNIRTLHKLKTYQALETLGYRNSLFIGLKSLKTRRNEIRKLWPCKWSTVLVIDCDCDANVVDILLDILQVPIDCEQGSDISDDSKVDTLVNVLKKYQQKVILISSRQHKHLASPFQDTLENINAVFEDIFDMSILDAESQNIILGITVKFQGIDVELRTLVSAGPPEGIKRFIDSDVIFVLLSKEHKLLVGRHLSDLSKYYVPRVLQHHIYLKEDILKLTDNATTFAVSGLQADQLKKYLPACEKIYEFVYDEKESNHTFKIVSDFSKIEFSAEGGAMKIHRKVGLTVDSNDVKSVNLGNKNTEIEFSGCIDDIPLGNIDNFSKSDFTSELENMKAYNEMGQKIKPEQVRYIILGNKNTENAFRALKALCTNVHWIHMEEGSWLWRDSNCNIDIIRTYIDDTKCRKYDIESVMEHNDRTMLLVAEPGMGKSTFLSYLEHEIKKLNPSVWVLRINLLEHTSALKNIDSEKDSTEKCKKFLWNAALSPEKQQDVVNLEEQIFLEFLEQEGKMVILLDGFDEISPDYSPNVEMLIRAIRDGTKSKIWVSSRLSWRQKLEDTVINLAFTLQPFSLENQIEFLYQYWNESIKVSRPENLRMFAKEILNLFSKTFSDKNEVFFGIPLHTKMLGKEFVKKVEEYCLNGEVKLQEKFKSVPLLEKIIDKKFDIYLSEKNKTDSSSLFAMKWKNYYLENHKIAALMYFFSEDEVNQILAARNSRDLEQVKNFLYSGEPEQIGIITDTKDEKPCFINLRFAAYFAAKWFTDNFTNCEVFISDTLFNSTYEVTRNIFDRIFAEDSEIHIAVLNNDIPAVEEFLKNKPDRSISDKGGRTALHLAASYNSPVIQQLLSFPGADANKQDSVLNWTPLRYADRTKSWLAMDVLLQNGANSDDIVLTRRNSKAQEWGQAALWECASKGHTKLLEFMVICGTDVNAVVEVPANVNAKCTLLQRASFCGQLQVVSFLVGREADINIRNVNNDTALHFAAESGSVDIIKLLLDRGLSANLTNKHGDIPLHVSARCGNLEATKFLVERDAALNSTNVNGITPLMSAAYSGKAEVFRYLTEMGADINKRSDDNDTALHLAARSDSVGIIKLLLNKGMSINLTNIDGNTPLHVACENGSLKASKCLVGRGAVLNDTNKYGNTPLMLAALNSKLEVFRYLTEMGADINNRNNEYDTALYLAVRSDSVGIIELLLDKGMSINLTNIDGNTPLHVACENGSLKASKCLVGRGAVLNDTNKYGNTPLMLAALNSKLEVFRYLTEMDADINNRNYDNDTALHLAARSDSVAIIKLLLNKGMSINLTNIDGNTPLHVACENGSVKASKYLVERGAALNDTNLCSNTPLMLAALNSKLEVFRYLTEMGADINNRNNEYDTALYLAVRSDSVGIIELLLDKGMSINLTNIDGNTPLHVACENGSLKASKCLVGRGAVLNDTNKYGNTPLMLAALNSKLEVFRYLTEMDADINNRNYDNDTALHLAARSDSVAIIKLLLDKGMSINLTNIDDNTPLHVACENGSVKASKYLVERGAALNDTNICSNTPLMLAALNSKLEVFRYLTEMGADINNRNNEYDTALYLAVRSDSVGIIELLLDKGMSINLTNIDGNTPLHVACENGSLKASKCLVGRGAVLNDTNKYGNTPLMLAALNSKLEVFRYLTEMDADINNRNYDNDTALHLAARSDSVAIIKLLLDKGMSINLTNIDDNTPLHVACENGSVKASKYLVERGAALNDTNLCGNTPLMLAALNSKLEVFRFLTEMGADINNRNNEYDTALYLAVRSDSVGIIELLLDKGMSINLTNIDGNTPLHVACENGSLKASKCLVERGAALNDTNKYGNTPLMLAALKRKQEVFRYLTEKGADINQEQQNRSSFYCCLQ